MKQYKDLIKKGLCFSFMTSSCVSMVPNNLTIQINKKKITKINLPLLGGLIGVMSIISSPFLITNFFLNGSYFDKLYDKYNIDIKRYHQYDGNNNKYAFPSIIMIEINKKEI